MNKMMEEKFDVYEEKGIQKGKIYASAAKENKR